MILFLKVFFTEFIAEMGDKTQLMLIALTSKYKLKDIILGTAAAILVLNGLAVLQLERPLVVRLIRNPSSKENLFIEIDHTLHALLPYSSHNLQLLPSLQEAE